MATGGPIKVQSGALAAALDLATFPATEKQLKRAPWLAVAHLIADGYRLRVSVTGLVGTISVEVEAGGKGETALPLARLTDLAESFPADAALTITADDSAATVSSGSGRSRFKLALFPLSGMPTRHTLGTETGCVELDARVARDLLSRVAFAASDDPSKYYLNGIHLCSADGALTATATDGYRLAVARAATSSTLSGLIVPRELIKVISRLLGKASGNVVLRRSERLLAIEGATFRVVTTLIDGTFPDTTRIIPTGYPNAATCSRASLAESIERFEAVADPKDTAHAVTLRWNGDGLHLGAPDGSEDDLDASTEGEAETTVQVRYFSEMLEALRGDRITIAAGKPGDRVIIITDPNDAGFLALQCPIHPRSA